MTADCEIAAARRLGSVLIVDDHLLRKLGYFEMVPTTANQPMPSTENV